MSLQVLPLAITMMAGPQIMTAIIFVTADRAVRLSPSFLLGILAAAVIGVATTRSLAGLLGDHVSFGKSSDKGSIGSVIQYALVALLLAAAVKSYLGRRTATPPGWLGQLMSAGALQALLAGFLLSLAFPSAVVALVAVGANLEQHHEGVAGALPFIGATLLIAALPLLAYVLFRRRAGQVMPRVRDWMSTHSWLISISAYLFFVVMILTSG